MEGIQHVHGGDIRSAAEEFGLKEHEILDFSANINPLGPSPKVWPVIQENFHQVINYPDPNCTEVKRALGRKYNLASEQIIVGNGAVELIFLLTKLLMPRTVLIPAPSFGEYEAAVISSHGQVADFPLNQEEHFEIDIDLFIAQLPMVDMAIICNPNNPTGKLTSRNHLETILKAAEETGTFVMVDEAFIDFVEEPAAYSVIDLVNKYNNLMVLYSMTKFYGIPGLRLGAAFTNPRIIDGLTAIKDPWNVNTFAQLAGVASLEDYEYADATRKRLFWLKERLYRQLAALPGLKVYKPSVNYVFVDVSGLGCTSTELKEKLAQKGILIRDCSSYKNLGNRYIRIAVKDEEANQRLVDELGKLV